MVRIKLFENYLYSIRILEINDLFNLFVLIFINTNMLLEIFEYSFETIYLCANYLY